MSVRRIPDDRELDAVPADWTRWTRFRGDECHAFERTAEQRVEVVDARPVRMRGSQAEPGHHLGRGTKWTKPRSTKT